MTSTPPKIGPYNDDVKRKIKAFSAFIKNTSECFIDDLVETHDVPGVEAQSIASLTLMDMSAQQATIGAYLDQREPKTEWFEHNARAALDRHSPRLAKKDQ